MRHPSVASCRLSDVYRSLRGKFKGILMFQASQQHMAKKITALVALPFAAALTLSACSDDTTASEDVNIAPVTEESSQSESTNDFGQSADSDDSLFSDSSNNSQTPDAPSTGERTESTFTNSQNGVEITMTYTAVGDEVVKQTTRNEIDYAASGLSGQEEARQYFEPMLAQGEGVPGYEQTMEFGETSAVEELVIDYSVADPSDLTGLPGYEGTGAEGENFYISMEQSRQLLLDSGFTEVE